MSGGLSPAWAIIIIRIDCKKVPLGLHAAQEEAGTGAQEEAGTGAQEEAGTGTQEEARTGAQEEAGTGA